MPDTSNESDIAYQPQTKPFAFSAKDTLPELATPPVKKASLFKDLSLLFIELVVLSVIFIVFLLVLNYFKIISLPLKGNQNLEQTNSLKTLPIPINAQVVLSISHASANFTIDSKDYYQTIQPTNQSSNITINTNQNKISTVNLNLTYDPTVITRVDISPGDFFQNPRVLQKNIDTNNGIISYTLANSDNRDISGKGVLAVISYWVIFPKDSFTSTSLSSSSAKFLSSTVYPRIEFQNETQVLDSKNNNYLKSSSGNMYDITLTIPDTGNASSSAKQIIY